VPKDTTEHTGIQNGNVLHFKITNITESGSNLHIVNQLMFKGNADLHTILNYASVFKPVR